MKFYKEIIINAPIKDVFEKFSNPKNLKSWQRGLKFIEHVSGHPNNEGSQRKLIYDLNNRNLVLTQTIRKIEDPFVFSVINSSNGLDNNQKNLFSENAKGDTIWRLQNEFVPLTIKMRLFLNFFPSTFKKQSMLYMKDFKNFIEKGTSVENQ